MELRRPTRLQRTQACSALSCFSARRAWGAASHPTHAPCPQGSQHAGPFFSSADPAPSPYSQVSDPSRRPHPTSPSFLRLQDLF